MLTASVEYSSISYVSLCYISYILYPFVISLLCLLCISLLLFDYSFTPTGTWTFTHNMLTYSKCYSQSNLCDNINLYHTAKSQLTYMWYYKKTLDHTCILGHAQGTELSFTRHSKPFHWITQKRSIDINDDGMCAVFSVTLTYSCNLVPR